MPKVTVLLTSYNHADYIKESIESVLSQTFKDFELLVVDDCSQDNSFEIINSFNDARLTAVRNEKNMGPEYAFDLLHKTARGEYIAIADSDNLWKPEKLQKQVDFLDAHKEYAAVFTRVDFIDREGNSNSTSQAQRYNVFNVENRSRQDWLRRFFFDGNCLCHPSVLIRREAYKECSMLADGLWQLPDFYKWIKLCLKKEIFVLDEPLFCFRLHGNNISSPDSTSSLFRMSNEEYPVYSLFYEMNDDDFKKVFYKEADAFSIGGRINIKFALSKILLSFDRPAAKALALNKLFEMLNDPDERAELKELYNYDDVSYKEDETVNIPYISSPLAEAIKRFEPQLFFDTGNGYNEQESIKTRIFPDLNGAFTVTFSGIKDFCGDKAIKGLRFDPDDSCVKAKIDRIVCDEKTIEFEANKPAARFFIEDGYDVFYTSDPSYTLHLPSEKIDTIKIEGTIFKINSLSLTELVNKLANENLTATGKFNELKTHTENLEKANSELTTALSELKERTESLEKAKSELTESLEKVKSELTANLNNTTAELNLVVNSISWKLTKPLRALKRVFRRLFLSR